MINVLMLGIWTTHEFLQTFPANIDQHNVVENQLPTPISAACLRLYPLAWNDWPDLRMEVYGCPSETSTPETTTQQQSTTLPQTTTESTTSTTGNHPTFFIYSASFLFSALHLKDFPFLILINILWIARFICKRGKQLTAKLIIFI